MANLDTFEQGEDIVRTVTLTDDDGTPFDTDTFTTIEIDVYQKHSLIKIGEYSLAAGTVEQVAPNVDGVIRFRVQESESEDAQIGVYTYEIITTEVDADFDGATRKRKFKGDCFILVSSNE